jgi:hypothetical protein
MKNINVRNYRATISLELQLRGRFVMSPPIRELPDMHRLSGH